MDALTSIDGGPNTTTAAADMKVFYNILHGTYVAAKNTAAEETKKSNSQREKRNPIVIDILSAAPGPMTNASKEGKCQIPIAKFRRGYTVDDHTLDNAALMEIARTMAPVKILVDNKDPDYIWLIANWGAPPEVPQLITSTTAVDTLVNPK